MRVLKLLTVILAFSLLVATPVRGEDDPWFDFLMMPTLGASLGGLVGVMAGAVADVLDCPDVDIDCDATAEKTKEWGLWGAVSGATLIFLIAVVNNLSASNDELMPPTELYASNPLAFQVVATSPKFKKPPLFFVKDLTKVRNGKVELGFGVGINLLAIGRD